MLDDSALWWIYSIDQKTATTRYLIQISMKPTATSTTASSPLFSSHITIPSKMHAITLLGSKSHWMSLLAFSSMLLFMNSQAQAQCAPDVTPPVALCMDATVNLDAGGGAVLAPSDVDNSSSDFCGAVSLGVSPSTFDCASLGLQTVTLTVTDGAANSATCTAAVTVQDKVSPTALCQSTIVHLDASGNGVLMAAAVDGGSTDNCGPLSYSVSPNSFGCSEGRQPDRHTHSGRSLFQSGKLYRNGLRSGYDTACGSMSGCDAFPGWQWQPDH